MKSSCGFGGLGSGGGRWYEFNRLGAGALHGIGGRPDRARLGGGHPPGFLGLTFVEGNIDGAFRQRLWAARRACKRSEIRMLAAIGIDRVNGAHALRGEFGDFSFVTLLLGGDFGLRFVVTFQRRAGGGCIEMRSVGGSRVENIMLVADAGDHILFGHFEIVGPFLQLVPEADIRIEPVFGEIFRGHMEGIGLHLNGVLTAGESFPGNRIDLGDLGVGHRKAAGRGTSAMHHDRAARVSHGAIVGIGIADVERKVIGGIRIHPRRDDRIKTFRHLAVALPHLGSELSRPAAHREGFQIGVASIRFHLPDFEFRLFFIGADQDRRVFRRSDRLDRGEYLRRERRKRTGRHGREGGFLAAGQKPACRGNQGEGKKPLCERLAPH